MYQICPKCQYERRTTDTEPETVCPSCGIIFTKWLQSQYSRPHGVEKTENTTHEQVQGLTARLLAAVLYVPENTESAIFYCRLVVYGVFVVWGCWFIQTDYYRIVDGERFDSALPEIGDSIMHLVNTPFHEAGHVVCRIFGRFMSILGGTLGQLAMPITVMLVFLLKERNTFGASIGLWWLGQSIMDVVPYINDARNMHIPLIGGGSGSEGRVGLHDWYNILSGLNLLHKDHAIADAVNLVGICVILLSFVWGGMVLHRQYRNI